MQTIETRYLGPTNYKGARIKAKQSGGPASVTMSRDYSLDIDDSHMQAAMMLMEKLGWGGTMYGGHTKAGMVFVFADPDSTIETQPIKPFTHPV